MPVCDRPEKVTDLADRRPATSGEMNATMAMLAAGFQQTNKALAESASQISQLAVVAQCTETSLQHVAKKSDVDDLRSEVQQMHARVSDIEKRVTKKRRDVGSDDENRRRNFIHHECKGACPGCNKANILNSGSMFATKEGMCEWDHEDGNTERNDASNMWPLCPECHKQKTGGLRKDYFRAKHSTHWEDFQKWVQNSDPWSASSQLTIRPR